ncbi:MAG: HAD family hydrolase [Lachnospiraceae bacterium]|nr:HAD family hydrolase [Lachnospiraceae bacterium]
MKLYQDYIFDLYGTLVDIRTDEEQPMLWNKMCLLYGGYGAVYLPEELHVLYKRLVTEKEEHAKEANKEEHTRAVSTKEEHTKAVSTKEEHIKEKSTENQGGSQKCPAYRKLYAHESYPEIPLEDVFREIYLARGIEPSDELVTHTGQMFRALSTRHIRLYAGAKELLCQLREEGRGVYLLSNAQRIFTERELRFLQIEDCFDGILISSDYGVKKPDERFFRILLEKYRIVPECALMIGNDLDSDIAGAKTVGMDTFYIHSGISPKTGRKVDADYMMRKMNLKSLQKRLLSEQ